jgi:outer membrane protein assembly factor BamB
MVLGASAPIFPADWPQHLGPERNAKSQESGFSWRTGKWGTIWTREAGEGFSAPVVFGGSIFLFHRQDGQEIIESLDQATGKTRWRSNYRTTYRDDFGFDEGPRAAPLATFDAVFTYGAEGTMTATQTATGKRLWQRNPMRELSAPKGYFGAASSPLLAAGKLIAAIGGPGGAGIVAFDLNSGKEVWRALDDEAGYSSPVAANIRGKTLLLCFTREGLAGIDPGNGAVAFQFRWRSRSAASVNAATPVVHGNQVFLTASYGTGAVLLDLSSGKPQTVWANDDSLSAHYATPVLEAGHLFGFDGRQEMGMQFRCVEWATGKVNWSSPRIPAGSVLFINGRLVLTLENGELQTLEPTPAAYRKITSHKILEPTVRAYPAFSNGVLYVRNGGTLAAVKLSA